MPGAEWSVTVKPGRWVGPRLRLVLPAVQDSSGTAEPAESQGARDSALNAHPLHPPTSSALGHTRGEHRPREASTRSERASTRPVSSLVPAALHSSKSKLRIIYDTTTMRGPGNTRHTLGASFL